MSATTAQSPPQPLWVRWVDRYLPDSFLKAHADGTVAPADLADARICLVVVATLTSAGCIWSAVAYSLGVGMVAVAVAVACVLSLGLPWLFSVFQSVQAFAMAVTALAVVPLCWPALYAEELWWMSAAGLPMAIVLAGLVLRPRYSAVWLVTCAAFLIATGFFIAIPTASSRGLELGKLDVLIKTGSLLALAVIYTYSSAARSLRRLATEELILQRAASEEALAFAERSSRARSAFLATMSHELRTPLNGVLGMADLARHMPPGTDLTEQLDVIVGSSESLLVILNDALDFAKIDSGKLALDEEPFDVAVLAQQVIDRYGATALAGKTTLRADLAGTLTARRRGDALRLGQVLANLVSNGIKFSPAGEVVLAVDPVGSDKVAFEVRDSGIGIDSDKLSLVFEPFRQADSSTTREFGGTGLGLSIAAELVDAMGGELQVESTLGVGSTFRFVVPLAEVDGAADDTAALQSAHVQTVVS